MRWRGPRHMTQHSMRWQWVTNDGLVKTGLNSSTSTCSDGSIGHMGILLFVGRRYSHFSADSLCCLPCFGRPLSPCLLAYRRRKSANVQFPVIPAFGEIADGDAKFLQRTLLVSGTLFPVVPAAAKQP